LTFTLDDAGEHGAVTLVHRGSTEAPRLERVLDAWAELLAGFTTHLGTTLARLPAISAAERQRILELSAAPALWPEHATVTDLFDDAVRRHPTRPAVTCEGRTISYAELNARVTRFAAALRAAGATRDQKVALLVDRSLELVIAILAVVKAGAAYVPIDPDNPADRIRFLLDDCGAGVVVTSRSGHRELAPSARWLELDELARLDGPVPEVPSVTTPSDLLYIIYTSGT